MKIKTAFNLGDRLTADRESANGSYSRTFTVDEIKVLEVVPTVNQAELIWYRQKGGVWFLEDECRRAKKGNA